MKTINKNIMKYGFGVGMTTKERIGYSALSSIVGFVLGIFIYNAGALGSYRAAVTQTWVDLKKIKRELSKLV